MAQGNTRTIVAEVFPSNVHPMTTPRGDRVTTNRTIGADLSASLRQAGFEADAGMTFGDFVKACRAMGIEDDMVLSSIEYGVAQRSHLVHGRLTVEVGPDGLEVREV